MRLGLDFDNTLIAYDEIIRATVIERGLLPANDVPHGKKAIRDALRALPEGDRKWQSVQDYIYTTGIVRAQPATGFAELGRFLRTSGLEVWIVSHKTSHITFSDTPTDLREAALGWMEQQGFFSSQGLGLARDRVLFTDTKEEKVATIARLNLDFFVDDLREIFATPGFPESTIKILVGDPEPPPAGVIPAANLHEAMVLLQEHAARKIIQACLTKITAAPFRATPVTGGRNSRCHRVDMAGHHPLTYFHKQYHSTPGDTRDRLGTEWAAANFMWKNGIRCIPEPLAIDNASRSALFAWVDGQSALRAGITARDIDALFSWISRLRELSQLPEAINLPAASEATFSLSQLTANLRQRRARFAVTKDSELQDFLAKNFDPALMALTENQADDCRALGTTPDAALPVEQRTLSPSDIGFHNCLRQADDALVFIDFEYFGWDDPVKLLCDFVLQPEQSLAPALCQVAIARACEIFPHSHIAARFPIYCRYYRLKWVMILLNEFLSAERQRREFSGAQTINRNRLEAQLAKARRMLAPLHEAIPI